MLSYRDEQTRVARQLKTKVYFHFRNRFEWQGIPVKTVGVNGGDDCRMLAPRMDLIDLDGPFTIEERHFKWVDPTQRLRFFRTIRIFYLRNGDVGVRTIETNNMPECTLTPVDDRLADYIFGDKRDALKFYEAHIKTMLTKDRKWHYASDKISQTGFGFAHTP